jgi:hypothetical protein
LFSALHELVALLELVELEVVLPVWLELETVEELVPVVDILDSTELVTLVALRESIELVAPAEWTRSTEVHAANANATRVRRCFIWQCSDSRDSHLR